MSELSMGSFFRPGAACRRSRLPGWLRLVIMFAVLLSLKYALPFLDLAPVFQVVALLIGATAFAWFFWWNCSPDRRGVALLVVSLWVVGIIKLIRL